MTWAFRSSYNVTPDGTSVSDATCCQLTDYSQPRSICHRLNHSQVDGRTELYRTCSRFPTEFAQWYIKSSKAGVEETARLTTGLGNCSISSIKDRSMETSVSGRFHGALLLSIRFVALFFIVFLFVAAAEGKAIRIDTHSHVVPEFYRDIFISKGLTSGGMPVPKWNVDEHLAFMNSQNIEISVLSVSTPGARVTPADSIEECRRLARQLNDYAHMVVTTYPERFQFFATLTLPDVEGSVAEAIYALDTLNAAGIVLLANSEGVYLGNPSFDPLMELLNARGVTVFVHPNHLEGIAPLENEMPGGEKVTVPAYALDFVFDTSRAAMNLVRMKVPERFPNIKFILAHSGGFVPFAAWRMSFAMSLLTGEPTKKFLVEIQSFYVETALSSSSFALASVLGFVPHDQIMFGTDYPYCPPHMSVEVTKSLDDYPLEDEQRHSIDFLNANRLLEKPLQHWRSISHEDEDSKLQGPQTI